MRRKKGEKGNTKRGIKEEREGGGIQVRKVREGRRKMKHEGRKRWGEWREEEKREL